MGGSEARETSSTRHRASIYHPCSRDTINFKDMARGEKWPNRLLAATTETRGQVQSVNEIAGLVREWD